MRDFFKTLFACLLCSLCHAQSPLASLVGGYERDRPSASDNTNYEGQFQPCFKEFVTSSVGFRGYDERQDWQGLGEVYYYLKFNASGGCAAADKTGLTKPIIVMDGFDPLDGRSPAKVYGKYLRYFPAPNDLRLLGNELRNGVSSVNPAQTFDKYDAMVLNFPRYRRGGLVSQTYPCPIPANVPNRDLYCQQAGYPRTVTFGPPEETVDGGADYIERNAMVLVELLRRTNATLRQNNSTEKIVIIGPSMGGLISRYALAYMEKRLAENPTDVPWQQQWNHNTRLWVSFDSPHLGGNIPIGTQLWVDFIATQSENEDALEARDKKLDSKAARQQLLHHFRADAPSVTPAIVDGINYRERFMQNLEGNGLPGSLGFPSQTLPVRIRRVALLNGSINGTRQEVFQDGAFKGRSIQACEKAFTGEVKLSKTVRGLAAFTCAFSPLFLPAVLGCAAALPITISTTKPYFSPGQGGNCLVFEGTFLGSRPTYKYANAFNSGSGLDMAPGGYYATQGDLADEGTKDFGIFNGFKPFQMAQIKFYSVIANNNFIATKSGLGYKWNNKPSIGDLGEDLSAKNLVCQGLIPFDAYYAPVKNEEHVFLTQQSVAWILNEIKGTPHLNPLPAFALAGPDFVCGTATYSISPALPAGAAVAWSTSNANVSITGGGVATRLNNYTGPVTIQAAVTSSCGNGAFAKAVTANAGATQLTGTYGYGSAVGYTLAPNNNVRATGITVAIAPAGLSGFTWQRVSTSAVPWSASGNTLTFTLPPYGGAAFKVSANNSCGTRLEATYAFYNTSGSATLRLYPNPADEQLNVQAVSSDSAAVANQIPAGNPPKVLATVEADVTLLDAYGQAVRQGRMRKGRLSFDTSGLHNGLYYLRAEDKKTGFSETKQVFVGH